MKLDLQESQVEYSLPELKTDIIIGSHARHESTEFDKVEMVDMFPILSDSVLIDFGLLDITTGTSTLLSNLEHYELILDASTSNDDKLEVLIQAQNFLLNMYHDKVLKNLLRQIMPSYNSIILGGSYRYKSKNIKHYDANKGIFFFDNERKSVKYSYLRFFQLLLLWLIFQNKSAAKTYFEVEPTLNNKIEILNVFNILKPEHSRRLKEIYLKLLRIYEFGKVLYNNSNFEGTLIYKYEGSREILQEAYNLVQEIYMIHLLEC